MKGIAEFALDLALNRGASYADVRVAYVKSQAISTKDMEVACVSEGDGFGLGIRVLVNGGWGFSVAGKLTRESVGKAVEAAIEAGAISAKCMDMPVQLVPEPAYNCRYISPHTIDPFTVSIDEKTGILIACAKLAKKARRVKLVEGEMQFSKEEKLFMSTAGSCIEQTVISSGFGFDAHAQKGNEEFQQRSFPNSGGQYELAGFEVIAKWNPFEHAERIGQEAAALVTAPICPQKNTAIILAGNQLALQIHESCGHACELDRLVGASEEANYAGASFLTPNRLKRYRYGSEIVNLVSDPNVPGSLGSMPFDDEGVQTKKVHLIENGIFSGYLTSRETAHKLGMEYSVGSMRAESCACMPLIRMGNVSLEPGDAGSLEDLIADTRDGILFDTVKCWSIDSMRLNFQFSTEIAWEIKKGKRTRIFKDPSYGGITHRFWKSCDAICGPEELIYWGVPNCGKGQPVQTIGTAHGCPPARFRNVGVGVAMSRR